MYQNEIYEVQKNRGIFTTVTGWKYLMPSPASLTLTLYVALTRQHSTAKVANIEGVSMSCSSNQSYSLSWVVPDCMQGKK